MQQDVRHAAAMTERVDRCRHPTYAVSIEHEGGRSPQLRRMRRCTAAIDHGDPRHHG